ncbi:MAG TPA: phosphoribosylanthranilate isomerase [Candidatus Sulfopaludibacter sp.]|nr:phosphoribosylanthranilate isomerase [Candidatus Sulfopaludibacter sp.]
MSLWIKICGNTSLGDARLAVEAGADAVGFVFAPSPRRVTVSEAAGITPHLPGAVEKIGVFVDATPDEIYAAVRACRLTGVQLHSEAGPELPEKLRALLGPELRILRVVHFGPEAAAQADTIAADPHVDALLVDSRTAAAVGGTGIAFDWTTARETLFRRSARMKMVAAGGLNPENVAEAIATLRPWGVDVVSGVEAEPGRKDPIKVRSFVAVARGAART